MEMEQRLRDISAIFIMVGRAIPPCIHPGMMIKLGTD